MKATVGLSFYILKTSQLNTTQKIEIVCNEFSNNCQVYFFQYYANILNLFIDSEF
jgi:hypothetical protein